MARYDQTPKSPGDYSPFLATKEPLLIVGGQAVNLWAMYYDSVTAHMAPFVSVDIDILGSRDTLREIANLADVKPQFFPLRPPTNAVGVVFAKDATGGTMLIEVLRSVKGVTREEVKKTLYTFETGNAGVKVQVSSPLVLLKAKIANLEELNQNGRQDEKHIRILFMLIPAYLKDLVASATKENITERECIDLMDYGLRCVTSTQARRILKQLNLDPAELFCSLKASKLQKVQSFLEHQAYRRLRIIR